MKIEFAGNLVMIDDASIVYRNLKGVGGAYNHDGDRNFAVVIPSEEIAEELRNAGFNVKEKAPRNAGEEPFRYLKVTVKYNKDNEGRNPKVYLQSGMRKVPLGEDEIGMIDDIDIVSVNMDISGYNWHMKDGRSGTSAYLRSMLITQKVDRFAD